MTTNDVQLLATRCKDQSTTTCRFLVDHRYIKYANVGPGVFEDNWEDGKDKFDIEFPAFPVGDWNYCRIEKAPSTGLPIITGLEFNPLPRINDETIWHSEEIDYSDHFDYFNLARIRNMSHFPHTQHDKLCLVRHPKSGDEVVMKIAQFPQDITFIETETMVYERLDGKGIAPRFLGYVTEAGRIVGFLTEYVKGGQHANPNHAARCMDALRKLWENEIVHGDAHNENFIVTDDRVYIIDFESSRFDDDATQQAFDTDSDVFMESVRGFVAPE